MKKLGTEVDLKLNRVIERLSDFYDDRLINPKGTYLIGKTKGLASNAQESIAGITKENKGVGLFADNGRLLTKMAFMDTNTRKPLTSNGPIKAHTKPFNK